MNAWTFLRSCLALCWLTTTIYVSIPDYPRDYPLWWSLCMDPNGYWHEVFYIAGTFVSLITLTYFWELLSMLRNGRMVFQRVIKRIEKDL